MVYLDHVYCGKVTKGRYQIDIYRSNNDTPHEWFLLYPHYRGETDQVPLAALIVKGEQLNSAVEAAEQWATEQSEV